VPADQPVDESELSRLRDEVRLLRDELATARQAEEKVETRIAKMRAARNLAEKSADLIRGQTPLAPEPIPFYRHGVSEPPVIPDTPALPSHLRTP
jgi:hypothetical protein